MARKSNPCIEALTRLFPVSRGITRLSSRDNFVPTSPALGIVVVRLRGSTCLVLAFGWGRWLMVGFVGEFEGLEEDCGLGDNDSVGMAGLS